MIIANIEGFPIYLLLKSAHPNHEIKIIATKLAISSSRIKHIKRNF